jgi:4-hydroxy-3-methylbut-2-enyl diphosphate reductase IspH
MTHGKRIPRTTTTKYRWNMIHHIPSFRAHDDSKRKDVFHIDMFSPIKTTNKRFKKFKKFKEMGVSMVLYGDAATPEVLGCIKCVSPY